MTSILDQLKKSVFGPKTVQVCDMTNPCPNCDGPGCKAEVYLDSDGMAEMMSIKCPKCGPVKTLYAGRFRPEPRFQKDFFAWRAGADKDDMKKITTQKREV
jgi:RNase P subunit RPR2